MYPLAYLSGLKTFERGCWYEPSGNDRISSMIRLLSIVPGDTAVDIGSGDGRVVLALAMAGAQALGIEKDSRLVSRSQAAIRQAKLEDRATIIQADMWQQSYHNFNKVVLYQFKTVMDSLEQKLLSELPSGARVVSNFWQFPHWKLSGHEQNVYLYIKD